MTKRVIISGGGTGGHIFPAIAIANALKEKDSSVEILFVGAKGKMEMEKVPAAGYQIIGLDIQGFQRGNLFKNLLLPIRLLKSVIHSLRIIRDFKPQAVVGVGGYASGPLLYAASLKGIPYIIQEQNSFAGVTNKFLGKNAKNICVAFDGMEQFFPASKIRKTGNPVRKESVTIEGKREEALNFFDLDGDKKTVLVIGGSLGARTLNDSLMHGLQKFRDEDIQVVWQTGKYYYRNIIDAYGNQPKDNGIRIFEFLNRMDLAYAVADVIISRAGAGTIAELCMVAKPVVLVPSPNVAEDHQTKNAMSLVEREAAVLVADRYAEEELVEQTIKLIKDREEQNKLAKNIAALALPEADDIIAGEVLTIIDNA